MQHYRRARLRRAEQTARATPGRGWREARLEYLNLRLANPNDELIALDLGPYADGRNVDQGSGVYTVDIRHAYGKASHQCELGESAYLGDLRLAPGSRDDAQEAVGVALAQKHESSS